MATVDEKGKLIEFNIEMSIKEPITGNIYKGKVLKVERGLQAAFVDYGGGKDGFLPLRDASHEYLTEQENGQAAGRQILKSGQEIIVQAVREVIGNKGALLTANISLPGRYLVLLPNKPGAGISRKIDSEEERKKIKNLMEQIKIPEDIGFIVRTAGINRTKQEINRDYQHLMRLWKEIKKKGSNINAPFLLYQETDFGVRSLRDYLTQEVEEILVDDYDSFRKMRAYLKTVTPRNVKIISHYKDKTPLFGRFQLEEQIMVIYQERVELKSGGYIIINPTEAMITIDVNSGRGSNKRNIEETAFKTNIEACEEIARQMRLRDLGGLIVIDFIDMMDKKNVAEVEKSFKKALSLDRARIQLSRISKFGLLELSRQKKQSTIQEISYTKCPFCRGRGVRPSLEYAALGAFRKMEAEAVKGVYSELKVVLPHEIAGYILNQKRSELLSLESSCGLIIHVYGSTEMPWDQLEIENIPKEKDLTKELAQEEISAAVSEAPEAPPAQQIPGGGETNVRKKRRRNRSRRKKTINLRPEDMAVAEPAANVEAQQEADGFQNAESADILAEINSPAEKEPLAKTEALLIIPSASTEPASPQAATETVSPAANHPEEQSK